MILLINELCPNIIGATVITGKNIGDKIFIPRTNLIPSDPGFPFKFHLSFRDDNIHCRCVLQ